MTRWRVRATAWSSLAIALGAACTGCASGSGPGDAGPAAPSVTSTLPPAKGGPLTDLPPCPAPPEPVAADDVADLAADLVVPEGAVVSGVEDLGELVSVRAFVPLTPIQVRRFYARSPEVEPFVLEDEVYEAEILYGAGQSRVFVRARAQCVQGSELSVFLGPEDGKGLPSLGNP